MNYYDILGVDRNADESRIRRAYRIRAKQLHPDVNRTSRAKKDFQLVNEAYQVLRNPEKRRVYDLRLSRGIQGRRVYYRPGPMAGRGPGHGARPHYSRSQQHHTYHRKPSRMEKIFDQVMFVFMMLVGLTALFYGLYTVSGEPEEGVNPYLAITFGVFFTVLFLFGWDKKQRMND